MLDPGSASTEIPSFVAQQFMSAQITAMPGTPEFCDVAAEGICDTPNFEDNTCCCKKKFVNWQVCMTEKDLSTVMDLQLPCSIDCEPKAPPTECGAEGQAYTRCRAMDTTGQCATCPPQDMGTIMMDFPVALKSQFMRTMATTSSQSPEFCDNASLGICADYANNACCCEPEFGTWQSCLTEKDFSPEVNLPVPCAVSCNSGKGGDGGGGGGGSSMTIIAVVAVILLLAVGGGGFFFIRKRRVAAALKSGGRLNDLDDHDEFKDEKDDISPKKRGFGGLFSRGKKDDATDGESNELHDDPRSKGRDRNSKRGGNPNNKRDPRTSNSGKRRSSRNVNNDRDIENGGLPTDLSLSQDESEYDQRSKRNNRSKRANEEDDSIDNDYGEDSTFGNRGSSPRKSARDKKRDLENSRRNNDSFRRSSSYKDFDDDISELDNDGLSHRSGGAKRTSSGDLPSKVKSTKKISSRDLKNLMKDREESSRRLNEIQDEMTDFQRRLAKRDREAEELRREREEQARRIKELEAQNQMLQDRSMRSSSRTGGSRRNLMDDDDYGSKSSSKLNYDNDDDDRNRVTGVGRSSRSKASMRQDSSRSLRSSSKPRQSGRSSSRPRERSRSGTRTLERSGDRRPQSRSPSSTRGLGKQASTRSIGRSASSVKRGESRDRESSRRSSAAERSSVRKTRSRSPRSYLRDED